MRGVLTAAFAFCVLGVTVAEDKKKDIDRLQGEWEIEHIEVVGKVIPGKEVKERKLTLKGDQLIPVDSPNDPGTVKLNPEKKPAEIDLTDKNKTTMAGIYRIDGDRWEVCFADPGEARPTEFKSSADGKTSVMMLKRKEK